MAKMAQQRAVRRSRSRCTLSPSARSIVTIPFWCPVVTDSFALDSRSNANPFSGSCARVTIASSSSSSSTISRRFADSAAGKARMPAASSSLGRVRVREQLKHSVPSKRVSQVQADSSRLLHHHQTSPSASTYLPCSSTGTIARSSREKPSRVPQETHVEFSK
jgi:hypothetical protein